MTFSSERMILRMAYSNLAGAELHSRPIFMFAQLARIRRYKAHGFRNERGHGLHRRRPLHREHNDRGKALTMPFNGTSSGTFSLTSDYILENSGMGVFSQQQPLTFTDTILKGNTCVGPDCPN